MTCRVAACVVPLWFLLLMALVACVPAQSAEEPGLEPPTRLCMADATYTISFDYIWGVSIDSAFPLEDGEVLPGFSTLICASHNSDYAMWQPDVMPSDAIRALLNRESTDELMAELDARMRRRQVFDFKNSTDAFVVANGRTELSLRLQGMGDFTHISCISKIIPSPDFFVGLSSERLCTDEGLYNAAFNISLTGWDGGANMADTYVGESLPFPPEEVLPITPLLTFAPKYGEANLTTDESTALSSADSPDQTSSACFPSHETVRLADGRSVSMDQLARNHVVLSSAERSSPVFMFSHRDPTALSHMLQLTFDAPLHAPNSLTVSPGHFIYRFVRPELEQHELVAAKDIRVGDALVGADGAARPVTAVSSVLAKGLYNPHTMSGDLLVSGVRVSCYTTAVAPHVASTALVPLRLLHRLGFHRLVDDVTSYFLAGSWNDRLSALLSAKC